MLNSLKIFNFQNHKESHLDFHPGVNAIIGETDSGKSAITRALNWCLNNKPGGDAFRSWWGGDTCVRTDLEEGVWIERQKRGVTKNQYLLGEGEQSQLFEAFGQNVPEEIQAAINMNPLNWQGQFDPHFLLSNSSGEVARKLNEVASLDVIDSALVNIDRKAKENNRDIKTNQQRIEELEEELKGFDYLDEMEKELVKAEGVEEELDSLQSSLSDLEDLCSRLRRSKKKIKEAEKVADLDAEELEGKVETLDSLKEQRRELNSRTENIRFLQADIKEGERCLKLLEKEFEEEMPDICPLCEQDRISQWVNFPIGWDIKERKLVSCPPPPPKLKFKRKKK